MTPRQYTPESYKPHANDLGSLFVGANERLLFPAPSTILEGFPTLMKMTGGFRANEFSLLCGSTGSGKTTLCANFSRDLIASKTPHFIASVETGYYDYIQRIMSSQAGKDWNSGDPVPVEHLKDFYGKHADVFQAKNIHLSLYEDRFPVDTLMADINYFVEKEGIKIAIVDNLNFFIDVTSASNQVVEMDRVTHDLIIFCKQVPVHLILICHPKKTDHGRVDSEFDIKGSSTAVQEAHNIFLFNRISDDLREEISKDSTYRATNPACFRELKIAKMRRRGKYVGHRLLLKSSDGVSYQEAGLYESRFQ